MIDGAHSKKVAILMKKKASVVQIYKLSFLLKKQIKDDGTFIKSVKFDSIVDFPKLSLKKMNRKIFCGSFYLKQGLSYLSELGKNGFTLTETYQSHLAKNKMIGQSSKIIGTELLSRHHLGKDLNGEYKKNIVFMLNMSQIKTKQSQLKVKN